MGKYKSAAANFEVGDHVCAVMDFFNISEMKNVEMLITGTVMRIHHGYLYVKTTFNLKKGERWSAKCAMHIHGPVLENGLWFAVERNVKY